MLDDIDYCETCQHCEIEPHLEPCVSCKTKYIGTPTKYLAKRHTNADRIRAMSDEGLAKFMNLCGHDFPPYCDVESSISGECDQNCIKCAEKWLKQPTEGD